MKTTISILCKEHQTILDELNLIEKNISTQYSELLEKFRHLQKFTIDGHHKREEEILFTWMLKQNPNSDATIIDQIRKEHLELESKQKQIVDNLEKLLSQQFVVPIKTLAFDVQDFIDLYREHIQIEENFIYMIADGLVKNVQR